MLVLFPCRYESNVQSRKALLGEGAHYGEVQNVEIEVLESSMPKEFK